MLWLRGVQSVVQLCCTARDGYDWCLPMHCAKRATPRLWVAHATGFETRALAATGKRASLATMGLSALVHEYTGAQRQGNEVYGRKYENARSKKQRLLVETRHPWSSILPLTVQTPNVAKSLGKVDLPCRSLAVGNPLWSSPFFLLPATSS